MKTYSVSLAAGALCIAAATAAPRNIVLILTDDHRFDAMGFMGHPFLETPNLDSLARNGVHLANAFVTTSLCSPSRASILTGLYAHHHGVVDNNNPVRPDLVFFPQILQQAGYQTAFIGKWHMGGESSAPQRGFDKWVSFRGQGEYWPTRRDLPAGQPRPVNLLNIDGREVPRKGYITDELTDYALDWLKTVPAGQPFFLYLSHKAVHHDFAPAERHAGRYRDKPLPIPASRLKHEHAPMWVQNQRNSWHGVDFPYYRPDLGVADYYRRYCETLLAVDESVGRVLAALRERGQLDDTLVVYMGDNGFGFGEHGLLDKRTAYEWSIRVPLLLQCPAALKGGTVVRPMVANIDLAPTLLEAAEVKPPTGLDGASFWPLARGESIPWRTELLYEYYWERNFPQTPTVHALRTDRYKYIHVHGVWDIDEFYDLQADPGETVNLTFSPEHQELGRNLKQRLFARLNDTGGMFIPLQPDRGGLFNLRRESGTAPAAFPPEVMRKNSAKE
ncbi:MAG: acetylglucosamine-6-sulfatase [Verrucomicrobia bacterium RIFCSPLOWO2_12_FULL_64_8]|nr:MAG: acetylglucosamine-6-sulfatase [Verrucomicrobia bacterium RIFCSPLOWO2_12_FULL_64_8]